MSDPPAKLRLGQAAEPSADMRRHLGDAVAAHGARNARKTAAALQAAELAAKKANLWREAAQIHKALALLAQGHVPRLLGREGFFREES